ncbi:MAG: protein-disulfide reductase DsbD domain-containing protein [Alphaproteobacteria bacterium]
MKHFIILFFLGVNFTILIKPALSAQSEWASADHMQARLLLAQDSIGEKAEIEGALQIRQSQGWHSYWRSPGDSGLAPQFIWEGSENIKSVEVSYPLPKSFDEMGLTTFGYDGEIVFPLTISLKEPEKQASLDLKLATMVCKDICIPQTLSLSLNIPKGEAVASRHIPFIDFAKSKIPAKGSSATLKVENIVLSRDKAVITAHSASGFERADIFLELGEFALTSAPEFQIDEDTPKNAMIIFEIPEHIAGEFSHDPVPYSGVQAIATLSNGREAIEQSMVID